MPSSVDVRGYLHEPEYTKEELRSGTLLLCTGASWRSKLWPKYIIIYFFYTQKTITHWTKGEKLQSRVL